MTEGEGQRPESEGVPLQVGTAWRDRHDTTFVRFGDCGAGEVRIAGDEERSHALAEQLFGHLLGDAQPRLGVAHLQHEIPAQDAASLVDAVDLKLHARERGPVELGEHATFGHRYANGDGRSIRCRLGDRGGGSGVTRRRLSVGGLGSCCGVAGGSSRIDFGGRQRW